MKEKKVGPTPGVSGWSKHGSYLLLQGTNLTPHPSCVLDLAVPVPETPHKGLKRKEKKKQKKRRMEGNLT